MNWTDFINHTKTRPPHELLVRACALAPVGRALDIGAGGLRDSRYLASCRFEVLAVDADAAILEQERPVGVEIVQANAEDIVFEHDTYSLVNAQYVLPFLPGVEDIIERIHVSLVSGGVFAGQFFGLHDSWNDGTKDRIKFHSVHQVRDMLAPFETLLLEDREWDGLTALGVPKHWHVLDFIVRRH